MTTVLADGSAGAADVAVASHTGQRRVRPSADAAHEAHITWLQGRLRAIAAGLEGHTAHCIFVKLAIPCAWVRGCVFV